MGPNKQRPKLGKVVVMPWQNPHRHQLADLWRHYAYGILPSSQQTASELVSKLKWQILNADRRVAMLVPGQNPEFCNLTISDDSFTYGNPSSERVLEVVDIILSSDLIQVCRIMSLQLNLPFLPLYREIGSEKLKEVFSKARPAMSGFTNRDDIRGHLQIWFRINHAQRPKNWREWFDIRDVMVSLQKNSSCLVLFPDHDLDACCSGMRWFTTGLWGRDTAVFAPPLDEPISDRSWVKYKPPKPKPPISPVKQPPTAPERRPRGESDASDASDVSGASVVGELPSFSSPQVVTPPESDAPFFRFPATTKFVSAFFSGMFGRKPNPTRRHSAPARSNRSTTPPVEGRPELVRGATWNNLGRPPSPTSTRTDRVMASLLKNPGPS